MNATQNQLAAVRKAMAVRSQREVAALLGCSFQAVQCVERSAFKKLLASARARELWQLVRCLHS